MTGSPARQGPPPPPPVPPPTPDKRPTGEVTASERSSSDSDAKGTKLGLGIPDEAEVSQVSAPIDVSRSDMRSTRPAWIDAALAGGQSEQGARRRVQLVQGEMIPGTRYRVDRWLGDGGMGQVYEATHVDLDRKVALKVLRPEASLLEEATSMFREEARRAGKIGSKYIAEVFDFAELRDGRLMFAMELVKGRSLAREIEGGPMPPARVIAVLRQVCKGLAAAHDAKIIHRDVKPENIMLVTRDGRADAVKLLDFGISTVYDESAGAGGNAAGTAHYVAPELVSGVPYGPRVDMYALGCMAYELLTGSTPFHGPSVESMLVAHVQDEVPAMAATNPDVNVPPALEAVVRRCLAKTPRKRYRDMRYLEAALCEAQIDAGFVTDWDDLPLPEVDDARRAALERDMPDPRRPSMRQRRWFWPVFAAFATVAALGLGYTTYAVSTAPSASELSAIDALVNEARAEAAQAYFVYPPTDDPQGITAYAKVRQLETMGSREARRQGEVLRAEFADTLIRLGDSYWSKPGGKPFSLDYYAQALVFDPDNAHAGERAGLTPGQLAGLVEKAESGQFSSGELATAAMLAALAEEDEAERRTKVEALRELDTERSALANQQLEDLIASESSAQRKRRRAVERAADGLEDPGTDIDSDAAEAGEQDEAGTTGGVEDPSQALEERAPEVDRAGSKRLSDQGWQALRAGQAGKALPLFQRAVVADSRNDAAHAGLAKISFDQAKYQSAARHAKRAARYAPRNAEHRIRLGDSYFKLFRYEDALEHYERAGELGHPAAAKRVAKAKSKL